MCGALTLGPRFRWDDGYHFSDAICVDVIAFAGATNWRSGNFFTGSFAGVTEE
jgi:hypothetical protein